MLKLSVKVGVSLKADNWAVASVAWDCFAFSVEPLWPETCLTPQVGDKAATMVERMRSLLPLRFRRTLDGDKCAINIIKSLVRTEDQRAELQDINRMCTPLGRFWPSCCRRIKKGSCQFVVHSSCWNLMEWGRKESLPALFTFGCNVEFFRTVIISSIRALPLEQRHIYFSKFWIDLNNIYTCSWSNNIFLLKFDWQWFNCELYVLHLALDQGFVKFNGNTAGLVCIYIHFSSRTTIVLTQAGLTI